MFLYDDIKVNYVYKNNKKKDTLVFLHGWGQNIEMMEPIANGFDDSINYVIIDLPGHGKSEEPKTVWSLEDYADMVNALMNELKIKNPVLIGHSFGGKISMIYAAKYKVEKLVLVSSPYKVAIKKVSLKVKILKKLAKIKILSPLAEKMKNKMGSTDYKNSSGIMREILVKHINTDVSDYCKKITVPTIIIWGTADTTVGIENAYEIESLVKDGAVIPYEGRSHFAYLENRVQTIKIIKSLIGLE